MSLNLEPKAPTGAAGRAAQPSDFRARLRARREQLAKGSTKLFVLPGYDTDNERLGGQLVARYRRFTAEELNDFQVAAAGEGDLTGLNAQFLIDACVEILFRDEDGTHALVEGFQTTYVLNLESGQSLGTIMGVDHLVEARDQMVAIFGENDLALNQHSGDVHRWMIAANADDGDVALGEA